MKNKFFFEYPQIILSLMKMEGLWALVSIVPIIVLTLLAKDFSNVWLFLLVALVMTPSIYALMRISERVNKQGRTVHFWQEYMQRLPKYGHELLTINVPYLALMGVLVTNVMFFHSSNPTVLVLARIVFILLMAAASLIVLNMMLIATFYSFPMKSLIRLAIYYLLMDFASTLKKIVVVIAAGIAMFAVSNFIIFFLVSFIVYLFYTSSENMLAQIRRNFIAEPGANLSSEVSR